MTSSSDDYERFVQQVMASLVGVTVHHKRVYTGRLSHRDIEIDVSFNYDVAGADLLFLVECKCYRHAVPVNDVEEFHSKIDDIGAHKGILVTTKGFQDGAVRTRTWTWDRSRVVDNRAPARRTPVCRQLRRAVSPGRCQSRTSGRAIFAVRSTLTTAGLRFESTGQFLGMLCMDVWEQQRLEGVAAFDARTSGSRQITIDCNRAADRVGSEVKPFCRRRLNRVVRQGEHVMGGGLPDIHDAVSRCRRCAGILDERRIIPRSGFPPTGDYVALVIGCEPGQAAEGRPTPEQYRIRFDWRTPNNRNTVRLLFKAIHEAGVDWETLFYTNAVKCPATPELGTNLLFPLSRFLAGSDRSSRPPHHRCIRSRCRQNRGAASGKGADSRLHIRGPPLHRGDSSAGSHVGILGRSRAAHAQQNIFGLPKLKGLMADTLRASVWHTTTNGHAR